MSTVNYLGDFIVSNFYYYNFRYEVLLLLLLGGMPLTTTEVASSVGLPLRNPPHNLPAHLRLESLQ